MLFGPVCAGSIPYIQDKCPLVNFWCILVIVSHTNIFLDCGILSCWNINRVEIIFGVTECFIPGTSVVCSDAPFLLCQHRWWCKNCPFQLAPCLFMVKWASEASGLIPIYHIDIILAFGSLLQLGFFLIIGPTLMYTKRRSFSPNLDSTVPSGSFVLWTSISIFSILCIKWHPLHVVNISDGFVAFVGIWVNLRCCKVWGYFMLSIIFFEESNKYRCQRDQVRNAVYKIDKDNKKLARISRKAIDKALPKAPRSCTVRKFYLSFS